jgi:hypothetical protein
MLMLVLCLNEKINKLKREKERSFMGSDEGVNEEKKSPTITEADMSCEQARKMSRPIRGEREFLSGD